MEELNSSRHSYQSLNALVSVMDKNGNYPLHLEKEAVKQYFLTHINQNTVFFHDHEEKVNYLIQEKYYDPSVFKMYTEEFVYSLFDYAYTFKFRFKTLLGAMKFFSSYSLKTRDGKRYLERYEDRVTVCALYLAQGDERLAREFLLEIITGVYQPATPTFANAGKLKYGEKVSCFILQASDNLEDISRQWANAAQLSKRGGGVGICITDLRAFGDPIRNLNGKASGLIGWCKIFETIFLKVDQLGQRSGAGVVWVNALHLDAPDLIECKKENIDDSVRLKMLNVGLVVPDILYHCAQQNKKVYLFSPYDVEKVLGKRMSQISLTEHYHTLIHHPNVRKKSIDAREYFQNISCIQTESGYPFLMHEDIVNAANPIKGHISGSNLCSEILQVATPSTYNEDGSYKEVGRDISCNLGSLNVYKTLASRHFEKNVENAVRMCTTVSNLSNMECVPSVKKGNEDSHAIGVGAMNLHGTFGELGMEYGSPDSLIFTDVWFMALRFYALKASVQIAKETGKQFVGFSESKYATGEALRYYLENDYHDGRISSTVAEILKEYDFPVPTREMWQELNKDIQTHGLYHAYLLAVAPTGNVSYVNNATSSIHPVSSHIEERHEGKIYAYYPMPHMTNENRYLFKDGYTLGYKPIIDVYAEATKHVDQGLSLTLFFQYEDTDTKVLDKARYYAWKKKIKTLYYVRMRADTIGLDIQPTCEACSV